MAVDKLGNVYLADTYNNTIRKVTPAGMVTTLAGLGGSFGFADGTGKDARFNYPVGLAMDDGGNIYVGDVGNSTIRKVTPTGVVTTLAGLAGSPGNTDGTGNAARFGGSWQWPTPHAVAVDNAGNVYVADNNAIRKITPSGAITTLAGVAGTRGSTDGTGNAARFGEAWGWESPTGIAVDSVGNVYVTDNGTLRKITPAGVVTTLAGLARTQGSNDGTGSAAQFFRPSGVAVDSAGNLYVADTQNDTIRKVTPAGAATTLAGLAGAPGSDDGMGSAARFSFPQGVAVDSASNVYVTDTLNFTIRKVTPAGVVTTLAGLAGTPGGADGIGSDARFSSDDMGGGPVGVTVDNAGNVYVADAAFNTIRKVTQAGVVTTLAGLGSWYGKGGSAGSADGTGSDARFSHPWGVAVDGAGNLYVADSRNNTIRKGYPALLTLTIELPPQETQRRVNLRRWAELQSDRELAKFDGRIETDRHGHIIMSPPPAPSHGSFQIRIGYLLTDLMPRGRVFSECPISTADGVKAADVAWASPRRLCELGNRACFPQAPELCVEILSPSNTEAEIEEKTTLYFDAGAGEVWICAPSGAMKFFLRDVPRPVKTSALCPKFPKRIDCRSNRKGAPDFDVLQAALFRAWAQSDGSQ